jgi:hypothetical protein
MPGSQMKLPRWLVMTLLTMSLLAMLGSVALWWVTWPERTARRFQELMSGARIDEANAMLSVDSSQRTTQLLIVGDEPFREWDCSPRIPESRTLIDMLCARQRYKMAVIRSIGGIALIAQRNKVTIEIPPRTYIIWDSHGREFEGDQPRVVQKFIRSK